MSICKYGENTLCPKVFEGITSKQKKNTVTKSKKVMGTCKLPEATITTIKLLRNVMVYQEDNPYARRFKQLIFQMLNVREQKAQLC